MVAALIVGYGSIGRRHARVLRELGCVVGIVSRRAIDDGPRFSTLEDAFAAKQLDYVIVATETSAHGDAVESLLKIDHRGRLLIEKPLGAMPKAIFSAPLMLAAVGYNLRFHPALAALAGMVAHEQIVSMEAYCGQYLPDWRPGTDYRQSYSADPSRGGGVLRDLSHELDYLMWLGGTWRRVAGIGGHLSSLEIKSDDCWSLTLQLERCPAVSVQLNYLDRPGRRSLVVNTTAHTFALDFMRNVLTCDGAEQVFPLQADDTYKSLHRAVLANDASRLCSLADGERVMRLIAASERAAAEGCWINA